MRKKYWLLGIVLLLLTALGLDLFLPVKKNFRQFDPVIIGQQDVAMWRSYYEKKPFLLFWQLANLLRTQFKAPVVRSYLMAAHAAKAAFIFKDGKDRYDYAHALPDLVTYYDLVSRLSDRPFDFRQMAVQELEWWIIRREGDRFGPDDWKAIMMQQSEIMYGLPAVDFEEFAKLRAEAMMWRDIKGAAISSGEWEKVEALDIRAWQELHNVLHR